jgi:hypothetical protein
MSFQAYIDNIKAKTGKTPAEFKKLAEEKNFIVDGKLNPQVKATEITNWLKEDFELAKTYQKETKRLKKSVRRNISRFPSDFKFELKTQDTVEQNFSLILNQTIT